MTQAKSPNNINEILKELNLLKALKVVMATQEGSLVINHILKKCELGKDPFSNSGHTAHRLGKQLVGRELIDKLVEAGISVDVSVFSKKSSNRIEELTKKINISLKQED